MIINSGIRRVVCLGSYPDEMARDLLEEADVQFEMLGE
jgi:deoxycytidylate deaminase